MAKNPQEIDKRIPIVMALLVALFCYYTWSPNSPFITARELPLNEALTKQQTADVKGIILVSAIHPLAANRFVIDAKTATQQTLQVVVTMPQAPPIDSYWMVQGPLSWNGQAIIVTSLSNGSFTPADKKEFK